MSKKSIFFAYQSPSKSGTSDNVDAIKNAISHIHKEDFYQVRTWEDLRNNGRILINPIFEAINNSDVFACDLSFLNNNVLFELGYAISKRKQIFILLNTEIHDAVINFAKIDILKTVGYSSFVNSKDIIQAIENMPPYSDLFEDLALAHKKIPIVHDVFYMSSVAKTQSELDISQFLQSSNYQVQIDTASEVEYRPFAKYLELILSSNNMIVHITNTSVSSSFEGNAKASLLAGFGCGRKNGGNVLLLAPKPYEAPIDYADIMVRYKNAGDCVEKLRKWLIANITTRTPYTQPLDDTELDLLKLGLGYDIAENEKDQLEKYFIETKAYSYAQNNNRAFFVGRKGTGKTAIYIVLGNRLQQDPQNYVIQLKPESSELLFNVEVSTLYTTTAQETSFFYSIWKFVIFSKLIIDISNRLKEKGISFHEDSIEGKILEFSTINSDILTKHFLEIMKYISDSHDKNALNAIYIKYINPMGQLLREYFRHTKYYRIAIIADNLDKTWDLKSGLRVQSSMILTLFEVTGHIEKDLKDDEKTNLEIKVILFLRKDIFDYIQKEAREPDKLALSKHEVDWTSFPEQLKKLIEKRFAFVLERPEDNISVVWHNHFDLTLEANQTVFNRIQEACLPRPRDILMFMRNLFESAVNNDHTKVNDADFEYATKEYSAFLYQNLIAEMVSEYPEIRSIVEYFNNKDDSPIEFKKLCSELGDILHSADRLEGLIDTLIANDFLKILNNNTRQVFKAYSAANKSYLESFWCFWKIKTPFRKFIISTTLTPQYSKMKKHMKF